MNLLGLTAISYLGACGITVKTALDLFVEAGDKGYMFDYNKLQEYDALTKEIRKNDPKKAQRIIKSLTPGYNIYMTGKIIEHEKSTFFEEGLKNGFLRPMTESEKFCYQLMNTKNGKIAYIALISGNRNSEEALELATEIDMTQSVMNSRYEQFKSNCEKKIEDLKSVCEDKIFDFELNTADFATNAENTIEYAKVVAKEKLEKVESQVLELKNKRK